eukprot:gnl/TRDRNA2_/TRDRNA2_92210_c0_seq1.p1 gnl/TRDRNA2_/TRDRNA2_92210_c0~~gnl/TRDRNA2_/TRDRNA2_92210_c0_seq1.p1  ORF type:complete len:271 (-),score=49.93 gnl/TRDRNA2_/TRDRNA2_92210_c0_seq1:2-742(-)
MAASTAAAGAVPKLTLRYLPFRAMAETARFMLHDAGIPYKDEVLWGQGFWHLKVNSELPFDKLPVLDIDGRRIAQSGAICRYVAKITGHYPADPVECAFSDSIFEMGQEMCTINPLLNCFTGMQFESIRKHYFSEFPRQLENVAKQLRGRQFFGGSDGPSYGDFNMFHYLSNVLLAEPSALDGYTEVQDWMARMESLPGLKVYLSQRPELVGIGTDPRLVDKDGVTISQKSGPGRAILGPDGRFVI